MGKYMRKAKTTGEVAVMDLTLGVRTRAKTLALRQRQAAAQPPPAQPANSGGCGYLQLRSRRLFKQPPIVVHYSKRQKHKAGGPRSAGVGPAAEKSGPRVQEKEEEDEGVEEKEGNDVVFEEGNDEDKDLGIEASFGENFLDFEGRERNTRESTPCSLIRDPETIRTPGSTTRRSSESETNRRIQNSLHRHIPTAVDMDEFFAKAEEQQQKHFVEKYNFDPVNDKPLPGRFAWEKLDP